MINIACLRLTTGEDIICDLFRDGGSNYYRISKVATIRLIPTDDSGNATMSLMPWIPVAKKDAEFYIKDTHVITTYEPLPLVRNQYNTIFGTGVLIPEVDTKKILLGQLTMQC